MRFGQASLRSLFYISMAFGFAALLYAYFDANYAAQFLTGYVIELSLSVDNLFVFILIFQRTGIPEAQQHRVLFWGVIGALLMRAFFITVGIAAFAHYWWLTYLFAVILVGAGIKSLVYKKSHGGALPFITQKAAFLGLSPFILAMILVETSDLIFAVDSIPAVLAVSQDRFIVLSSNIFAVMGLRSLYFVLSTMVHRFKYLDRAVAMILIFVGCKMALDHVYRIPIMMTLVVILGSLAVGLIASLQSIRFHWSSPAKKN